MERDYAKEIADEFRAHMDAAEADYHKYFGHQAAIESIAPAPKYDVATQRQLPQQQFQGMASALGAFGYQPQMQYAQFGDFISGLLGGIGSGLGRG